MDEKVRINLTVDKGIPEILERLANGRNKMGDYLSTLVLMQSADDVTVTALQAMDNEAIRLMVQGLAGRVKMVEGRLEAMQSQLAAVIAQASLK